MRIRRGSLYLADLVPRRGSEPGKVRPVLAIQTDLLNEVGHPSTWVLPCTTQLSGENLLRVVLPRGIAGNREECEVMIDQSAPSTTAGSFALSAPCPERSCGKSRKSSAVWATCEPL